MHHNQVLVREALSSEINTLEELFLAAGLGGSIRIQGIESRKFDVGDTAYRVALIESLSRGERGVENPSEYLSPTLVGAIELRCEFEGASLDRIAVLPNVRGLGIGRTLICRSMKELGIHHLELEVRESNFVAQKFYQKLGFEKVGRRPSYYPSLRIKDSNGMSNAELSSGREAALLYTKCI